MKLVDKVKAVEADFGQPIRQVMSDFANDHSYSFTIATLGFHHNQLIEYKSMFKPRKTGYTPRPHMVERNKTTAPKYHGYTVRDICALTGLKRGTIRNRILSGWPIERILNPRLQKAGVANLGVSRNNKIWSDRINEDCRNAQAAKANRKRSTS